MLVFSMKYRLMGKSITESYLSRQVKIGLTNVNSANGVVRYSRLMIEIQVGQALQVKLQPAEYA